MNHKHIRIKMCGMTREADIAHAVNLGVDAVGLIFHPKSKRYVSIERACELLHANPLFVDVVAVLVNPSEKEVRTILERLPIQWLQFHGSESPAFCRQFHLPYIKAIPAISESQIKQAMSVYSDASAILLDTPDDELFGGSGRAFDWDLIPSQSSSPLILAGGLNSDNVVGAIRHYLPAAVDVCTGIEANPGIKDHQKMASFVNAMGEWR